jgi:hypothetical protein
MIMGISGAYTPKTAHDHGPRPECRNEVVRYVRPLASWHHLK